MGAETEVIRQSGQVLDVQYRCTARGIDEIVDISAAAAAAAATTTTTTSAESPSFVELDMRASDAIPAISSEPELFVPAIRSGSFADIGPRRYMEDEHIRIDDLSSHLGSLLRCPTPSAFYGVFDGHGGPDAAAYIKRHAIKLLFENADFPQALQVDDAFLGEVENSVRKSYLHADLALADDCTINKSSGTTVLTALVFGRLLLVANAGDCRAVLCRKGEVVEMSQDHRPIYDAERQRVEECGGYIDDGYLNGVLSVSRALGDWDLKLPQGSTSPLIAEPEFRQIILTEDDEFLIIGCDGIWDVMSSQQAVSIVRRGLQRHDNPERCARELVTEALRRNTFDNLTVIVVCFTNEQDECSLHQEDGVKQQKAKVNRCSLSTEALCSISSWLEKCGDN